MEGDQRKPYFLRCEPPYNWNHVNGNSTCFLPGVNHNLNNRLHGWETATFTDHVNTTTGNETQNRRWSTVKGGDIDLPDAIVGLLKVDAGSW